MTVLRFAVFSAALVASIASAMADGLSHHLDPHPMEQYQRFRDQVILPGKCPDWRMAVDAGLDMNEQIEALDACWRDCIAPRS